MISSRPQRPSLLAVAIAALAGVALHASCATEPQDPLYVDGRAVASAGDSVLAITRQGDHRIYVRRRADDSVSVRAEGLLRSPHHLQAVGDRWYVSDIGESGAWWIVVFNAAWEIERRVRVDGITDAPHQFAVLPDGRIVLEARDGRLVALADDTIETFVEVERGPRTGFLAGAQGGVLYALPDRWVALFNAHGNVRWRQAWEWREDTYAGDLAVDANGRTHILIGEGQPGIFRAFTMSSTTGEIIRWSDPSPDANFAIARLGEITPVASAPWFGRALQDAR